MMFEDVYNNLAQKYDSLYEGEYSKFEDEDLFGRILPHIARGSVLDVGCGTGILIDYMNVPPEDYFGIDPSEGMLAKFEEKYPLYPKKQIGFEELPANAKYDTILSLYGSASYIPKGFYQDFRKLLNEGGHFLIIVYKKGYFPKYYDGPMKQAVQKTIDYKALKELGLCYKWFDYVICTSAEIEGLELL